MRNLLKKLQAMSNKHSDDSEGSTSSRSSSKSSDKLSSRSLLSAEDNKPLSGLSNWLNSVANRHSPSPPSSSNLSREERMEPSDYVGSGGLDASDTTRRDSGSSTARDPEVEEEYQIQLALELSAKEDPEAVQIEAVKQISLGTCAPENTPAEIVAYRYWNYNALGYDDKIMDGFYDLYGVLAEAAPEKMPSLIDLQEVPVSDNVSWEAVLVNRETDATLLKLEQKALEMVKKSESGNLLLIDSNLVQKLAILVADSMGGPVENPDYMTKAWRSLSHNLKATAGSMVLLLGSLRVGLARHRALLFKVLADRVGIPCRLVKGHQYTGSDEVAMNFVRINDGREFIVDLMADPGALIPADAAGSHIEYDGSFSVSPFPRDIDSSSIPSTGSGIASSSGEHSEFGTLEKKSRFRNSADVRNVSDDKNESSSSTSSFGPAKAEEECKMSSDDLKRTVSLQKGKVQGRSGRNSHTAMHARSPSWTEGVSSPAVRKMKVKDVSQYMIDAAKENPQLAQKLHDVLLESGVVAPPNLFTEVYSDVSMTEKSFQSEVKDEKTQENENHKIKSKDNNSPLFLPPLPPNRVCPEASPPKSWPDHLKPVKGLGFKQPLELREGHAHPTSESEVTPVRYTKNVPAAAGAGHAHPTSESEVTPVRYTQNVPAAAAAAVVASSMVVAVAKSNTDSNIEFPVAAAATATAAAVVATTAAVSKQCEQGTRSDGDAGGSGHEPPGSGDGEQYAMGTTSEGERISDRSAGNDSAKSDVTLDDVADCEIPWEDISLGDRIGLGSYGEVHRGEWHGTEVAVKRFLDQDIYGESLEEFKSEVRIMRKLRHPNVVLFMGAVTRPPNLSIVTEFLPRGSLYRLLHRPNNQLDERRRLRMALDAARGMNYLHNCSPVIVHRDLKSPNLLVDRNWIVKVCDFGLSRMKHSTFLSSRSTAGTAEWMAPEVLRNEPSDEKCDVYSFGVILWELCTMQQPWMGMNPMQVVGAVGFQHRRLDIPDTLDPAIADIIRKCWQTDPRLRPTFTEIMAALRPLQRPITATQVPRPISSAGRMPEQRQQSGSANDPSG